MCLQACCVARAEQEQPNRGPGIPLLSGSRNRTNDRHRRQGIQLETKQAQRPPPPPPPPPRHHSAVPSHRGSHQGKAAKDPPRAEACPGLCCPLQAKQRRTTGKSWRVHPGLHPIPAPALTHPGLSDLDCGYFCPQVLARSPRSEPACLSEYHGAIWPVVFYV